MTQIVFIISAFVLTYFGVGVFRRWSVRREILDVPNERSSHTVPTPRGGGLVIVLVCLLFYTIYAGFTVRRFSFAYLGGAVLIAVISWFDDLKSVPAALRFLFHAIGAALAIFALGGWQKIYLPLAGEIDLGLIGIILTFFWIIWLTNAYNFMDGIDGIAGTQGLTAGTGWLLVGLFFNLEITGFLGGVLALSNLGFLMHNWQPAKIFMGDVGSAFLGYTFAVLPLIAANELQGSSQPKFTATAVFLVWLFVFDTLYTFFRRLLRGEKFWRAHRSHLYQRLVISGYSHRFVTILYGVLSSVILAAVLYWLRAANAPDALPVLLASTIGAGIIILCYGKENG
ncbi:MAG TPA: glycosyltransferase family 4 protein [Pyrinomonadaceae bacterium]|jgi:UDP-N-acetylmuramyl pentapeptide phosphotransferase/UDP-N-acetylglucosamine-1-phosphate transferase